MHRVSDTKPSRETMEENVMIDNIEGRRKIEETKTSDVLTTNSTSKVIIKTEECSFSRVEFSISRLIDIIKTVL
jgi:hypothetical protein